MQNSKNSFIFSCQDYFYNTITKEKISKNSPNVGVFLEETKDQSIQRRLFRKPETLQLVVVSTWSCNLRCPFCYVLKRLRKDFKPQEIDYQKLEKFICNHKKEYSHEKGNILLIGGEPLIAKDVCKKTIEVAENFNFSKSITTNLSLVLDKDQMEILKKMDSMQISIDGPEDVHNKQRKNLNSNLNPTLNQNIFKNVIANLKNLLGEVDSDKITIAVSTDKKTIEEECLLELVFVLKSIGVKKIQIGSISNSDYYKPEEVPMFNGPKPVSKPCCCFRYMQYFCIDGEKLTNNYFYEGDEFFLGNLDSSLEEIKERYKNSILNSMPIMQDETCRSCPVLDFCWGQCLGQQQFKNHKPSELCFHKDSFIEHKRKKVLEDSYRNSFIEVK
jgi:radical SAM protein with 4Fe4S-binding SPASM domain